MESRLNASGVALVSLQELLTESRLAYTDVTRMVADLGPGSFTGSKVAVTIVKTFGMSLDCQTLGVSSFDLIDCRKTVVVPSRKGEYFLREEGHEPIITKSVPEYAKGYGISDMPENFPLASNFCQDCTATIFSPEALVPLYIALPSISTPKDPRTLRGFHD